MGQACHSVKRLFALDAFLFLFGDRQGGLGTPGGNVAKTGVLL